MKTVLDTVELHLSAGLIESEITEHKSANKTKKNWLEDKESSIRNIESSRLLEETKYIESNTVKSVDNSIEENEEFWNENISRSELESWSDFERYLDIEKELLSENDLDVKCQDFCEQELLNNNDFDSEFQESFISENTLDSVDLMDNCIGFEEKDSLPCGSNDFKEAKEAAELKEFSTEKSCPEENSNETRVASKSLSISKQKSGDKPR